MTTLYQPARIVEAAPLAVVKNWLARGWNDFKTNAGVSLALGLAIAIIGGAVTFWLIQSQHAWVVLPLLAGAMLVGPLVAVVFYRIARAEPPVRNWDQIALVGAVLMLFALMWVRVATILYAIIFGLSPFYGTAELLPNLLTSGQGLLLITIGSLIGGIFAAFGFAISAFSLPMLIARPIDGFSAMGLSLNAAIRNVRLSIIWGAVVTVLITIGMLTGFVGFVLIFPLLGYATWHAYEDLFEGYEEARKGHA